MSILINVFDITSFKEKDLELHQRILRDMKGYSETLLYIPMPDVIKMTQSQYDQLMKLGNMPNMYHSDDRMYVTPYNVMEVRVQSRNRLTFKEAHSLDDKDFEKWEKSVEGEDG